MIISGEIFFVACVRVLWGSGTAKTVKAVGQSRTRMLKKVIHQGIWINNDVFIFQISFEL